MKVETTNLLTVKMYAWEHGVTPQYIYKLVEQSRMSFVEISGVHFVDIKEYPTIPVANRRK